MRARTRRLKDCWVVIGCSCYGPGGSTHALAAQPDRATHHMCPDRARATFAPLRRWREHRNRGWAWNFRQPERYRVQPRLNRPLMRSQSTEKNSDPPLSGAAAGGGGEGGGVLGAAVATSSGAASPAATSVPEGASGA